VVEDGMVIGVLTETNQFVRLSTPEENVIDDDLETIYDTDVYAMDGKMASIPQGEVDTTRTKQILKIRNEHVLYSRFRVEVRGYLANNANRDMKLEIVELINGTTNGIISYKDKLEKIQELLKSMNLRVEFVDDYELKSISELSGGDSEIVVASNGIEQNVILKIPKMNLIGSGDNYIIYHLRMADELIRFHRVRNFMLEPRKYLAFLPVDYQIHDTELLVPQNMIRDELNTLYGRGTSGVITGRISRGARASHDTTDPSTTNQIYDDSFVTTAGTSSNIAHSSTIQDLDNSDDMLITTEADCSYDAIPLTSVQWRSRFSARYRELVFNDVKHICSFNVLQTILRYNNSLIKSSHATTTRDMKLKLIECYNEIETKYGREKVIQILKHDLKPSFVRGISSKKTTIQSTINSETYYLTTMDIWMLARKYDLPIVLYSANNIPENDKTYLLMTNGDTAGYYFLKISAKKKNDLQTYRILYNQDAIGKTMFHTLSNSFLTDVMDSYKEFDSYLMREM
jgi:hypothetical protein